MSENIRPIFIRVPKVRTNCPWTGYSRSGLYNLCVPCKANGYSPEVPAKCDKKRGNLRGTWMIPFDALIEHITNLPTPGMKSAEACPETGQNRSGGARTGDPVIRRKPKG